MLFRALGWTRGGRSWIFTRFASGSRLARWVSDESVSGPGSTLEQTQLIREWLPTIWRELGVSTLLDIPCGDGNWIRSITGGLERYIGADIVPLLVEELNSDARANEEFLVLDLVTDPLPRSDAVLCRDALVHLSDRQVHRAIGNIRCSGARYLIATTFPGRPHVPGRTGGWRPMDLEAPPFALGPPKAVFVEGCSEEDGAFSDKSLGVWEL